MTDRYCDYDMEPATTPANWDSWQHVREAWAEDRPIEYFDGATQSWVLWTDPMSIDVRKGVE